MIGDNGAEDPEKRSSDDVEGVVSRIHNPTHRNESSTQARYHDQECFPDLTFVVHYMQFATHPECQVEQTSKRRCNVGRVRNQFQSFGIAETILQLLWPVLVSQHTISFKVFAVLSNLMAMNGSRL